MAKKKITIEGSNLLQSLEDPWGGNNDTQQAQTVHGTTVPAGAEWGMNRGEVERFMKHELGKLDERYGGAIVETDDAGMVHIYFFKDNESADAWKEDRVGVPMMEIVFQMSSMHAVEEDGFHVTDNEMNVGMKYDEDGLDVAKVSDHFIWILKAAGISGDGATSKYAVETIEDGFFIADESLNVGVKIDNDGIHANNILEYEII